MSEVFEWIEIDQDFCSNTFGTSPCVATGEQCFNTIKSCKDQAHYAQNFITLKFCDNRSIIPANGYYIPTLEKASISGGRLNPIGVGAGSGALGIRSQLSVQIKDHSDDDKLVDKYRFNRSYIAKERGTFWTKWRARNQYYLGRPIRHCIGDIDYEGNVTNVITRHFFITDFNGPSGSGFVSFEGKDILSQFTDEKAVLPRASTGVLLADITNSATTLTATPSGIGNLEYPASGFIRIKKEVMQFTRSGDVFTVVRGQYGTTADKATANDTIQICVEFFQKTPAEILQTILEDYGNVPTQYLDLTGWNTEKLTYLNRVYSTLITEPTGITTLVNEMCEQMFFYLLWDDRLALLKMRAVRPIQGDTIHELDEDFILADSVDVNDLTEQLITEINVYYGLLNPAEKANEPKNYAGVQIIKNVTEEGVNRNNSTRVKQVFCRFIPRTNSSAAIELGNRYLQRYGTTPRQIQLAIKQTNDIKLGDFAQVSTRLNVDVFGNQTPLNIQILETAETKTGVILTVKGQEFYSEQAVDPINKPPIIIDLPLVNVVLRDIYDANYDDPPVSGETIVFTVKSGTVIGGHCSVDAQGNPKDPSYLSTTQIDGDYFSFVLGSREKILFEYKTMPILRRNIAARDIAVGDFIGDLGGDDTVAPFTNALNDIKIMNPISAFKTGSWPSGVKLVLNIEPNAYIIGQGGFQSIHTSYFFLEGIFCYGYGSDGGDAIEITHPIEINNQGVIGGGGAGGDSFLAWFGGNNLAVGTGQISRQIISGAGAGYYSHNVPKYTVDRVEYLSNTGNVNIARQTIFESGFNSVTTPSQGSSVDFSAQRTDVGASIFSDIIRAGSGGLLGQQSTSPTNQTSYIWTQPNTFIKGLAGRAVATGSNLITWLNKGQVYGDEL